MKVKDVMTRDVVTTDPRSSLAAAARLMWDRDCGALPVVDSSSHVISVITDRDICRAVTTKARSAARISVGEIAGHQLYTTAPDDDTETALQTMKARHVRRLPVVDNEGRLSGILSIDDLVLNAGPEGVREGAIVDALKSICGQKQVGAA